MATTDISPDQLQIRLAGYSYNAIMRMYDALGLRQGRDKPRKNEAVPELARFLGQPEHLEVVKQTLSPKGWQALSLDRLRDEPATLYSLLARLQTQGMSEAEALSNLEQLLVLGCLIHSPTAYGGMIEIARLHVDGYYTLNRRVSSFPLLIDYAHQHAPRPQYQAKPVPMPAQEQPGVFAELRREAYMVLQAAANGQIRLTAAGVPYRVDASKLATAVENRSIDGSPGLSSRKGQGEGNKREPAPKLWFLLSLLMASDLIRDEHGKLEATAAMKEFLQLPAHDQARALHAAWLDCCFDEFGRIESLESYPRFQEQPWVGGDPESADNADRPNWRKLRMARRAIDRVLRTVARENGEWIEVSHLATATWTDDMEFLVPLMQSGYSSYSYYGSRDGRSQRRYSGIYRRGKDYQSRQLEVVKDWPEVEGAFVAQVVAEPLHWLGLVDLGLDETGQLVCFRLSPIGKQVLMGEQLASAAFGRTAELDATALIVQPNFDLVVMDVEANFGLIARLDEFAERRSLHGAAVYRLTRDSVVRGLEKGLTGQGIMELLEETGRSPLPQNVRYSVEEWARLYERVHLRRQATLLEADSAEQMESWLSDSVLSPLVGKRLSPVAALVPSEHREEVMRLLKERMEHLSVVDYSRPAQLLFRAEPPALISVPAKHDEPYLRYCLGRFAERLAAGDGDNREVRYRITPESIGRATASGLAAADIASFLLRAAVQPVPADVMLRVKGWGGAFKPLGFESVVAVQTPPGLAWPDLETVPEIAGMVLRRLGLTLALIAADNFDSLRAILAERGITLEIGLPPVEEASPPPAVVATSGTAKRPDSRSRKPQRTGRRTWDEMDDDEDDDLWEDD